MRETSGPAMTPIPEDAHLLQPLITRATQDPDLAVVAYRAGDGFADVTAGDLHRRVRAVAKGLIASGVKAGDRVALMSATRLEWAILDYGILAVGATTVPVYETSSAEQLHWIVEDSGAVLLIVETPAMRETFAGVPAVPTCREVIAIDEGALDTLERRGTAVDDAVLDGRIARITTDHLASIVYTSGTTGRPKGCMLTHGNLRTNVLQNLEALGDMLQHEEVLYLFLPMAHTLSKIIFLVGMEWGAKGVFATDMAHLQEELPIVQPTMVAAVPRVFEKVFNAAQHKAHSEGKGAIFDHAAEVAIRWSRNRAERRHHALLTSAEHAGFEGLVYRKVHAVFGGRLRFAFSGGGPLGERLTHFFNGIGVKVFEGYGLTETSPTLTLNRASAWKPGTVGQPLAATSIRIAEDGEILAKGPQVFQGYWHNPPATAETFDEDGWFRTGDIGELDDEGFLRITGRKKELIVTAAGKNVAPGPLEDRLRAHPLISQALVVGDGRPFVAALVTLDEDAMVEWAAEHSLSGVGLADLIEVAALRQALDEAVAEANRSVSRAESIRQFAVLPRDLTIAAGELTPTLKVRRAIVEKTYGSVIEGLFGTPPD